MAVPPRKPQGYLEMNGSIDSVKPEDWDRAARAALTAAKWAETGFSLETLNEHLARPFGEVALVDRCLAFALWQQGHRVLALVDEFDPVPMAGHWVDCAHPQWEALRRYRIAAKPEELVLPSIDWSHVTFDWIAQDEDGTLCGYNSRPRPGHGEWGAATGAVANLQFLRSAKPGKGDWTKLIVQRPERA